MTINFVENKQVIYEKKNCSGPIPRVGDGLFLPMNEDNYIVNSVLFSYDELSIEPKIFIRITKCTNTKRYMTRKSF